MSDAALYFRGGIDVRHNRRTRVFGPHPFHILGRDGRGQGTPGSSIGNQHRLAGIQDFGRLGHEMHAALDDHRARRARRLDGQLQAVPDEIGNAVIDVRSHVIVREDYRIPLFLQSPDGADVGSMPHPVHQGNDRACISVCFFGFRQSPFARFKIVMRGEFGPRCMDFVSGIDPHGVWAIPAPPLAGGASDQERFR